jgi:hypothetical protein
MVPQGPGASLWMPRTEEAYVKVISSNIKYTAQEFYTNVQAYTPEFRREKGKFRLGAISTDFEGDDGFAGLQSG